MNRTEELNAQIASIDAELAAIAEKRRPLDEAIARAKGAIKAAEAAAAEAATDASIAELEAERARASKAWLMKTGSEEHLRAVERKLQAAQQSVEQRKAAAAESLASARAGLAALETEAGPLGTQATNLHHDRVRLGRAWLRARAEEIARDEYDAAAQQLAEARVKLHAIAELLEAVEGTHDHGSKRAEQQQAQYGTHGFAPPRAFEVPLTLQAWPVLDAHKGADHHTLVFHTIDSARTPRADPRHRPIEKVLDVAEFRQALAVEMAQAGVQP